MIDGSTILVVAIFFGFIGALISSSKNQGAFIGFLLGGLLSLLGIIILLFLKEKPKPLPIDKMVRECPHCKESMRADASVCPHCQRESPAWSFHDGRWWFRQTDGNLYWLNASNKWELFKGDSVGIADGKGSA